MQIYKVGDELFHADERMDRQTDFTKPIVASRNFANAPKNCTRQMYPAPFAFNPHNIFPKIQITLTLPLYLDCWVLCQPIFCICEILSCLRGVAEDWSIVGWCTKPNVKYLPMPNEGISFTFGVKQSQVRIIWTTWSQRWRQRVAANRWYFSVDTVPYPKILKSLSLSIGLQRTWYFYPKSNRCSTCIKIFYVKIFFVFHNS